MAKCQGTFSDFYYINQSRRGFHNCNSSGCHTGKRGITFLFICTGMIYCSREKTFCRYIYCRHRFKRICLKCVRAFASDWFRFDTKHNNIFSRALCKCWWWLALFFQMFFLLLLFLLRIVVCLFLYRTQREALCLCQSKLFSVYPFPFRCVMRAHRINASKLFFFLSFLLRTVARIRLDWMSTRSH